VGLSVGWIWFAGQRRALDKTLFIIAPAFGMAFCLHPL